MLRHKNRFTVILTFIISTVILLLLINSYKDNNDHKSLDRILFVGNKNIPPIVYEEDGNAKGVAVDIVKALGKKVGYRAQVQASDWTEAQANVVEGEADALIQINPSPEREKLYDFSDPLLESQFSIFTDSGSLYIKNMDDLKNKFVGVEEGGYAYNLLQKYDEINIVTIPKLKVGFQKIKSGELDALVSDRWIGEYELARSNVAGIQIVGQPIETQYSRIAVKKGNKELLSIINNGLKEINDDNTMNDILREWGGQSVIYFTRDRIINIILTVALGIIMVILLISAFLINRYRRLSKRLKLDVRQRTQELYETNELLRKANMELEKISMIDGLTSIYNRRYFDKSIEKAWKQSLEKVQPLALLMIDIDDFKMFNDTHGHLAGDQILKSIANEIKNPTKNPDDFVARFGGEELAVLLVNTSRERAMIIAEEIRGKVEKIRVEYCGEDLKVTVSIGVAVIIPNEAINTYNLIHAADEAMYQAKAEGRNKVVMYDEA